MLARSQLLGLGLSEAAIRHRVRTGRLHPVRRGVYAVGRRVLERDGQLMAAVLSCGAGAVLSHTSAAELWGLCDRTRGRWGVTRGRPGGIEVTVAPPSHPRQPGLVVHRACRLPRCDRTACRGIPVTTPIRTLIDLATCVSRARLEAAVNEANKLDLTDPERLRSAIAARTGQRGVPALRELLDRRTFALTDSELERRFLPIARSAGLPRPETGVVIAGFRVDFLWPRLGLIVETDGLRYHRTPAAQERDRRRDQAHAASGFTTLRFTHSQVAYEPESVEATLSAVARRLGRPALRPRLGRPG